MTWSFQSPVWPFLLLLGVYGLDVSNAEQLACSVKEGEVDPSLKEMQYDIGYGEQTFMAYVEPDVHSMYHGNPPSSTKVVPKFNGFSVKFINMSNKSVRLHW